MGVRAPVGRVHMPWVMRVLLAAIGGQVVVDIAALVMPGPRAIEVGLALGALAIDLGVLVLLARGNEVARGLVRIGAGLGMAIDALLLLGSLAWAPHDAVGLGAVLMASAAFATSAVVFAILGRDDVMRWAFDRWLARHDLDSPGEVVTTRDGSAS